MRRRHVARTVLLGLSLATVVASCGTPAPATDSGAPYLCGVVPRTAALDVTGADDLTVRGEVSTSAAQSRCDLVDPNGGTPLLSVETWRGDAVRDELMRVQRLEGDRTPIDASPLGRGERIGDTGFVPWTCKGTSVLVVISIPGIDSGRSAAKDVPALTEIAALRYADQAGCPWP